MRLKAKGFSRNRQIGFTFPGIDPKKISEAVKNKRNNQNEESEPKPEPKMKIGPIAANGSIGVDFNTDMIAPEAINQRVYQKVFQYSMTGDDGTKVYGKIMKK